MSDNNETPAEALPTPDMPLQSQATVEITSPPVPAPVQALPGDFGSIDVQLVCERCKTVHRLQANLQADQPLKDGSVPFPNDNKVICSHCQAEMDMLETRRKIESQFGRPILPS